MIMNRYGMLTTTIHIKETIIVSSDKIRVLGFKLDAKMNFKPYVSEICNRASRQINAVRRICKHLNIEGRLKIYRSFIESNFLYCPVVWIFCGKANSNKLEKDTGKSPTHRI